MVDFTQSPLLFYSAVAAADELAALFFVFVAMSVTAEAAAVRLDPPPFAIGKRGWLGRKSLSARAMEQGRKEEDEMGCGAGGKWQVKILPAPPLLLTASRKQSSPLNLKSCAPRRILPYTWQARRVTVTAHSVHYAPERSNPVQTALSLVSSTERAHRCVASHQS